jgi:hypothetical protein
MCFVSGRVSKLRTGECILVVEIPIDPNVLQPYEETFK